MRIAALLALIALPVAIDAAEPCDPELVVLFPEGREPVRFAVEVADEPAEQARGLMFRTEMAADAGMIFPFEQPRMARFWMRNTVLPLDILFIGDDGRVVNIAEFTTPYSEKTIPSDGPVRAVLEINAGLSQEHGLKPGTPVQHPVFEAAEPPFACAR